MPLNDELKAILACPKCKGGLEFHDSEIRCLDCQLSFAVEDDVPNMLLDEARPLSP